MAAVLSFFIAGLLYLLCLKHVDNLGAYSIPLGDRLFSSHLFTTVLRGSRIGHYEKCPLPKYSLPRLLAFFRRGVVPMRRSSCLAVLSVASLFSFSSCGGGTHPLACGGLSDACVAQRYVYATTAANEVLVFPVSQTGTLGSPTSLPGPAITGGSIAVSRTSGELFVADHVLNTVSAFV